MKKKGQVAKAVDDLFGAAKFSRESERRETPLDFPYPNAFLLHPLLEVLYIVINCWLFFNSLGWMWSVDAVGRVQNNY